MNATLVLSNMYIYRLETKMEITLLFRADTKPELQKRTLYWLLLVTKQPSN